MDRLQSMRVFQRVVEEGGFAVAARALDMSPAVVTRLVGDLEEHLGARLLQRTTRRMALTEAGEHYLERLRVVLQELDDAEASVAANVTDLSGVLHVAAPPVLAAYLLAPAVGAWLKQHPRVSIEIVADEAPLQRVEEFDVTFLIGDEAFDADIVARPLWQGDRILCAAPDYLRDAGTPKRLDDLATHTFLRSPWRRPGIHGGRRLRLLPAAHAPAGTEPVEISVHVGLQSVSQEVLYRAALDGAGIALLPRVLVASQLAGGHLVQVLPDWGGGTYTLYAAIPSRRLVPARTRAFLEFIQAMDTPAAVTDRHIAPPTRAATTAAPAAPRSPKRR